MGESRLNFNLDFLEAKPAEGEKKSTKSKYLVISNTKLAIISVATFGLYELYWFYKHWKLVEELKKTKESVVINTIFAPLSSFTLFKNIFSLSKEYKLDKLTNPKWLALAYLILVAFWRATGSWWLISMLSFLPLFPIQNRINFISNKETIKKVSTNFSLLELAIIVVGSLFLFFVIFSE